ncbi:MULTISPECIES: LysR family transcriptional regulator [unclassified Agarivorans]|uniref:LysR family transcriptional regulator n=1 Tax=unclassified Agarivorans TaxID=2636026 RepID=UPI003D7CA54F
MDIDLIQAFCQLAKDRNYTLAAARLFISQSALTKKIKRLEESIGVALFTRGRNGAELTQAGASLLPEAVSLTARFVSFERLASCVAAGEYGHLKVGFGISTYLQAPLLIAKFKQQFPHVHITLNDLPSSDQVEALLDGDLHLSFNRLPDIKPPLKGMQLFSDGLAIAVNSSQRVDESNILASLAKLNYLQLRPSRGQGLATQIERYFSANQLSVRATQEANDILTLLTLVSADLGYTIVPQSTSTICQDNIRLIPIHGPDAVWDVGLIWNDSQQDGVRDQFINAVSINEMIPLGGH